MKFAKLATIITITVVVTCILIFTFTQEPFKVIAPVKILWYSTANQFPLYVFAAATFGIGLLIGFFAAAYYYIAGQAGIRGKKKEIARLETEIAGLKGAVKEKDSELERLLAAAGKAAGNKVSEPANTATDADLIK